MPFIGSKPPFAQQGQEQYVPTVQDYTSAGWEIIADGPSGTQLRAPRKLSTADGIVTVLGAVCIFIFPPVGVLLIICALIDHLWLCKRATAFAPRC